jgi:hypothetical protein
VGFESCWGLATPISIRSLSRRLTLTPLEVAMDTRLLGSLEGKPLAGPRQSEHFWYAARKGAAVIADLIFSFRCTHISQVIFNQLFCFVQPFDLSYHLLLISSMVNSVNLIILPGEAVHFYTSIWNFVKSTRTPSPI